MKRNIFVVLAVVLLFSASDIWARESLQRFSIADIMENPENASKLEGVSFYFGDQGHPATKRNHGEYRTNKKTNAFNKSDLVACEWAMMSALIQLRNRALDMGANAVINVKSNYKNREVSSETEFTCGAGNVVAGVALIGTIVEL
jgi:hypothetical protein